MKQPFFVIRFEDPVHNHVTWQCVECTAGEEFTNFLAGKVANRFHDSEAQEEFSLRVDELKEDDICSDRVKELLSSQAETEESWIAGEAFAEAFLEEEYGILFPWNMARDKRTSKASLPGPDIVGLIPTKNGWLFAFGEVKTSSEDKRPPGVMDSMCKQIFNIASDSQKQSTLIRWLSARTYNEKFKNHFKDALKAYLVPGVLNFLLFGVLVRDTDPDEKDLSNTVAKLRVQLPSSLTCSLTALYLPWAVTQLATQMGSGGPHE